MLFVINPLNRIPPRSQASGIALLGLLASLSACKPNLAELPPGAIAQVGPRTITVEEFSQELRRRGVSARNEKEAAQRRNEILASMIDEEAIVQRALAEGLDRDPELQQRFRRMLAQELRERSLGDSKAVTPPEDDLKRWYANHASEFTEPPQFRAALVAIRLPRGATDEMRALARQRLEVARKEIESSSDPAASFTECVRSLSDDPSTRRQGGDTGWLTPGRLTRWADEVTAAVFTLPQPGALSPVIATPTALYLLRLSDLKPARVRPFDEVRARVEHEVTTALKQEREKEFLSQARRQTEIRENPVALAAIPIPAPSTQLSQTPPPLPSSPATRSLSQP